MGKLGPIIKQHRLLAGEYQKAYAKKLGISNAQMNKLERGLHEPKEATVLKMLELLTPGVGMNILRVEVELEHKKTLDKHTIL